MTNASKMGLRLPTDPRWVNLAEKSLAEILTDHAYCEQKAASTCISLIQQFPERERLVQELAPVVTEEWGHFRQVLREMKRLDIPLGRQRKDEYVNRLLAALPKGLSRDQNLLERLLVAALIEARSCERFRLLSLHLQDPYWRQFYHQFMVSEAGHYHLFLDLARDYFSQEQVAIRWKEWLATEASIMKELQPSGSRMH
jgi:tRNA 2-(methylsulfanyl)-N6-isopentenyladenosine37 hydroxylase